MSFRVAIIILNWNGWEDTVECLESLFRMNYIDYDVIVVDNASEDDSIQKIREYCAGRFYPISHFFSALDERQQIELQEFWRETVPDFRESQIKASVENRKLILIKNETNYGFAEGNNIGIRYALETDATYVLLLNNDTVVDPEFLKELVETAESNGKIGVVGPTICYYHEPQVIQTTGANQNFWTGRPIVLNHRQTVDKVACSGESCLLKVDYVYGACLLAKKHVIQEVGMLDPTYFLYAEEKDWCFRIARARYEIVCDLRSKIWHKSEASTTKKLKFSIYCPARNTVLFMRRYATAPQFLSFMLYFPIFKLIQIGRTMRWDIASAFLRGFFAGLTMKKYPLR
jgi:GT2 family glycosyltransferase